ARLRLLEDERPQRLVHFLRHWQKVDGDRRGEETPDLRFGRCSHAPIPAQFVALGVARTPHRRQLRLRWRERPVLLFRAVPRRRWVFLSRRFHESREPTEFLRETAPPSSRLRCARRHARKYGFPGRNAGKRTGSYSR